VLLPSRELDVPVEDVRANISLIGGRRKISLWRGRDGMSAQRTCGAALDEPLTIAARLVCSAPVAEVAGLEVAVWDIGSCGNVIGD
jgi:hypothetical protein